jgi:hypothetical protein
MKQKTIIPKTDVPAKKREPKAGQMASLIKGKNVIFVLNESELERSASLRELLRELGTDPRSKTIPFSGFFNSELGAFNSDDAVPDILVFKGSLILLNNELRGKLQQMLMSIRENHPKTAIVMNLDQATQFMKCQELFPEHVHVLQLSDDADNRTLLRTAAEMHEKLIKQNKKA